MQDDGIRLKFYQPQAAALANCYNVAKQEQIGDKDEYLLTDLTLAYGASIVLLMVVTQGESSLRI